MKSYGYIVLLIVLLNMSYITYKQQKELDQINLNLVETIKHAHFIGCYRATLNQAVCTEWSNSFKVQMKKDLGL